MPFDPATPGSAITLIVATASDLCDLIWAEQAKEGVRPAIRVVRGPKAESERALFDEFAAALQFPYYFGENWPAFDDCLSDLEWLPAAGHIVVVANAVRVLAAEPADAFATWLRRLERIAAERSDRGGPTFRVALHATPADSPALREKMSACPVAFDEWVSTSGPD